MAKRSNNLINLNKFKIVRPCSNLSPKIVKNFINRKIDIIFFEKYADLNRKKQGSLLFNLLKNSTKKVISIKYGNYTKQIMNKIANNSKFIISFFHQKEFITDNESSFYIPELSNENNIEIAFKKIMNIIEKISKSNIQTKLIAKKNQMFNKCENALIDLCKSLS